MKYLQDDKLTQWTGILTNVTVGHSRVLNGRVEAYSMKRAGSDKKYAAVLGEKYVEQIHQDQELAAKQVATTTATTIKREPSPSRPRKRSSSVGILHDTDKDTENDAPNKRRRSCSFDQASKLVRFPTKRPTSLGDFTQQATRRLMTDLILTLNASFPDYDFGSVKASDFAKVKAPRAISAINHHLAEWARKHQSVSKNVLEDLWESINEAVPLKDSDVYSFVPPDGSLMTTWEEEEEEQDEHTASTNLWSFYYLFVNKATKRILLFTATESMKATTISDDDDQDMEERYIGVTEVEPDGRFDLDPAAATPGGIPISSI